MANEDKLFDLMEKMHMEFNGKFESIESKMQDMKTDIKDVKGRVINIENDHGKKLNALFDGYTQLNEKVDRIEKQVSKQEEIIIRKVK